MFRRLAPSVALAATFPALAGAGAPPVPAAPAAKLTIHERLIIRVPRMQEQRRGDDTRWKEKSGPKCITANEVTGAAVGQDGEVDLVLGGVRRMRAQLDDHCPALTFYSGFYLKPGADGRICAKRDAIRSRSGRPCAIRHFRRLTPRKP